MIPEAIATFARHLEAGEYFEAHEVLEPPWLEHRDAPAGRILQGLIQFAAALEKHKRGEPVGCERLLRKALPKIDGEANDEFHGIDLIALRNTVENWLREAPVTPTQPVVLPRTQRRRV